MSRSVQRQRVLPTLLAPSSSIPRVLDDDDDDGDDGRPSRAQSGTRRHAEERTHWEMLAGEALRDLAAHIEADRWDEAEDAAHHAERTFNFVPGGAMTEAERGTSALVRAVRFLVSSMVDERDDEREPDDDDDEEEDDGADDDAEQLELFDDDDDDDAEQLELFGDE